MGKKNKGIVFHNVLGSAPTPLEPVLAKCSTPDGVLMVLLTTDADGRWVKDTSVCHVYELPYKQALEPIADDTEVLQWAYVPKV